MPVFAPLTAAVPGLPDPQYQAEFYDDVPLKRLIAWVVDTVVIVAICAVIVPFTAFTALFFLPLLYVAVGLLYRVVTLAGRSATWGMRLTAIEFRTLRGERLDAAGALLHTLGYSVSLSFVVPQVVSVGLMLLTPRRQGLTDLVLGTAAINRAAAL